MLNLIGLGMLSGPQTQRVSLLIMAPIQLIYIKVFSGEMRIQLADEKGGLEVNQGVLQKEEDLDRELENQGLDLEADCPEIQDPDLNPKDKGGGGPDHLSGELQDILFLQ